MSIRQEAADALARHLPPYWDLRTDPRAQDGVKAPTVLFLASHMDREDGGVTVETQITTTLLVPEQGRLSNQEDLLEDCVLQLIGAIEKVSTLTWTSADRGVFQDAWPAFEIILTTRIGIPK